MGVSLNKLNPIAPDTTSGYTCRMGKLPTSWTTF